MSSGSKLQRWTDLLAALLRRHYPATQEELMREVPGYGSGSKKESVRRTFERDKVELRKLGVPIETVYDGEEAVGYRLRARHFYLPYLSVVMDGRPSRPKKVDGFRVLAELSFTADELASVTEAARRLEALGDPVLADTVRTAMRKLATDLPLDAVTPREADTLVPPRARPDGEVFEKLDDALSRRKRTTFVYRSLSSDTESERTVEPYGLFFLGQHWYLAACDRDDGRVRNFRLSRISAVQVNSQKQDSADYEIPAGFRLREHARSRQAWELGDGDGIEAVVEFRAQNGAVRAAAALGAETADPARRGFAVRRLDTFVRWLLALGGAAVPVSPPELVEAYREQLAATLAIYREEA